MTSRISCHVFAGGDGERGWRQIDMGNTVKMSIKLHATSDRHRCMTERLLKVMLNLNETNILNSLFA